MIKDYATREERLTLSKRELAYLCAKAVQEEEESLRLLQRRVDVTEQNLRILSKKRVKWF
jgi:hypothetical protein